MEFDSRRYRINSFLFVDRELETSIVGQTTTVFNIFNERVMRGS